jgi:hypothetical protein
MCYKTCILKYDGTVYGFLENLETSSKMLQTRFNYAPDMLQMCSETFSLEYDKTIISF